MRQNQLVSQSKMKSTMYQIRSMAPLWGLVAFFWVLWKDWAWNLTKTSRKSFTIEQGAWFTKGLVAYDNM